MFQAVSYRGMCHERLGEFVKILKGRAADLAANPNFPSQILQKRHIFCAFGFLTYVTTFFP
jgi:hypothetical protein